MRTPLTDAQLRILEQRDAVLLEKTQFPIVTVSATFREELRRFYGHQKTAPSRDIVFSRAHFSMALGVAVQAWTRIPSKDGEQETCELSSEIPICHPSKAWLIDPTNYVQSQDWAKIRSTETIGRLLARNALLKWLKDKIDTVVRNRLPITSAITPPLLKVFGNVQRPIISFHYESGNILAGAGKKVVQVVTDPHVRDQYLKHADLPNIRFCVFDQSTKTEFLRKAEILQKRVNPARVIVTGPPIDPRIVACRQGKNPQQLQDRPLRLCITTGGLGTNKSEVHTILHELFDLLRKRPHPVQILAYAGTNQDFVEMFQDIAKTERIKIDPLEDPEAHFRLIAGDRIMENNDRLIEFAFPWADVFITKPSGDMAYDAAAAGCALLFLQPWGEWEENIEKVFTALGVGIQADPKRIKSQVKLLSDHRDNWFARAQQTSLDLPELFLHGSAKILHQAEQWQTTKN